MSGYDYSYTTIEADSATLTSATAADSTSQIVVIVDAYSTGRYIAPRLNAVGYKCIHIQTKAILPSIFSGQYIPENFVENIILNDDISVIAAHLTELRPFFVIAGSEMGVEIADRLNHLLKLPSNDWENHICRFDKYAMAQTITKAGLPAPLTLKAESSQQIIDWAKANSLSPVVVKPIASAGNDHVTFCKSDAEIHSAFEGITESKDIFDRPNTHALAESFLVGTEYIVNCVSHDGLHRVSDVWECVKYKIPGKGFISAAEKLIAPDHLHFDALVAYTFAVIDALGIKFGPSHLEIMFTESGPVLIEAAARLQGCVDPSAVEAATGESQLSLTIKALTEPEEFIAGPTIYTFRAGVYRIFAISPEDIIFTHTPPLFKIKELPSHHSTNMNLKEGGRINKTVDIATTVGYLHFVHRDLGKLEEDYLAYRRYEQILFSQASQLEKSSLPFSALATLPSLAVVHYSCTVIDSETLLVICDNSSSRSLIEDVVRDEHLGQLHEAGKAKFSMPEQISECAFKVTGNIKNCQTTIQSCRQFIFDAMPEPRL